jgi:hypothetical protein
LFALDESAPDHSAISRIAIDGIERTDAVLVQNAFEHACSFWLGVKGFRRTSISAAKRAARAWIGIDISGSLIQIVNQIIRNTQTFSFTIPQVGWSCSLRQRYAGISLKVVFLIDIHHSKRNDACWQRGMTSADPSSALLGTALRRP